MPKTKSQILHEHLLRAEGLALGAHDEIDANGDSISPANDEIVREQLAEDRCRQPFVDFVREQLELLVGDFRVLYDYVAIDGWREIDLRCIDAAAESWVSTIYLAPGQVDRFPPALDIPF